MYAIQYDQSCTNVCINKYNTYPTIMKITDHANFVYDLFKKQTTFIYSYLGKFTS